MGNRIKVKFYKTGKDKNNTKITWIVILGILVTIAIAFFLLQIYRALIAK